MSGKKPRRVKYPPNPHAAFMLIENCKPIAEEVESFEIALRLRVELLRTGAVKPNDSEPYDQLCEAIGTAQIRVSLIGAETPTEANIQEANRAMEILNDGVRALDRMRVRWEQGKGWGFDGPGLQQVLDALDVYLTITENSSGKEMQHAVNTFYKRARAPK